MKSYGVANVEQLAKIFEYRAEIAEKVEQSVRAAVFREVVQMLRDIEYVGWRQDDEEDER